MHNILFIALEFPPINTTGNFRSLKFVKHLQSFGINPIVVTLDIESGNELFGNRIDMKLLDEIPDEIDILRVPIKKRNIRIIKSKLLDFLRIYFNVDDKIIARLPKKFLKILDEKVNSRAPKAIYVSMPPFSVGRLGIKLSDRYKIPLIVDMRDAWAYWGSTPFQTRFHFYRVYFFEKRIFKKANKIIGVTPQLVEMFKRAHPEIPTDKFEVITNGFDEIYHENKPVEVLPLGNRDFFSFGYIGSFYFNPRTWSEMKKPWWKRSFYKKFYYTPIKEDWLYRTPFFFFKTLQAVFEIRPDIKKRVRFEFVGQSPSWLIEMVKSFDLIDNFIDHGFVNYHRAIEIQDKFDIVLASSEKVNEFEHYCLPSKIFDCIKNLIPVIGFVTEGIQKQFIIKSGIGQVCNPDDLQTCVAKLISLIDEGWISKLESSYLTDFNRKELTKKLALVINNCLEAEGLQLKQVPLQNRP